MLLVGQQEGHEMDFTLLKKTQNAAAKTSKPHSHWFLPNHCQAKVHQPCRKEMIKPSMQLTVYSAIKDSSNKVIIKNNSRISTSQASD